MLLPGGHHRGPGEAFVWQTDSTLGHTPEDERLLKLRNCTGIGKVRWDWIEGEGVETSTVQIIPMAEMTILVEDLSTLTHLAEWNKHWLGNEEQDD